ncbi:hypothetical protein VIBNISO65_1110080 [Vibrio nigripulchritudo SO65]|nr:hypothetical protein VIBNIAM115_1260028 [Vibrio nigripulchritudo AM115]CCN41906.1 hypothetical protein VIBNIFTn2_210157 [Vibrio nigripulchritudo FTn2]CCN66301.1 hypothetical protein VIBNIPon4_530086 [Vibrio nigripulchritudo POn4]CCN74658.1 hypothetical protein VIBNISO65_1110080 [Vibrio nigripulchritudo SO65]
MFEYPILRRFLHRFSPCPLSSGFYLYLCALFLIFRFLLLNISKLNVRFAFYYDGLWIHYMDSVSDNNCYARNLYREVYEISKIISSDCDYYNKLFRECDYHNWRKNRKLICTKLKWAT